MMACVVAWFCECGSSVRMSFCAAQRSVTAWACAATSARMKANSLMVYSSRLLERKRFLDQRREIPGAERNHRIVEIVVRIVQHAADQVPGLGAALPEKHVGPRPLLQHVREILAAHGGLVLGDDVFRAKQPLADLRGELRLAGAVHRRRVAMRIGHLGGGAERFGRLAGDLT